MSHQVVELTGTEHAEKLLPLLKEYADKLRHLVERSADLTVQMSQGTATSGPLAPEAVRLICMFDTLVNPVTDLCRTASGLLEHAALESSLWAELKLRLDETEEYVRFSPVVKEGLVKTIDAKRLPAMRTLVEKTGRYKAPF